MYVCLLLLTHIHTYTCMYMCIYINCNYHTHPPQLTNGQTHTHAHTHIASNVSKDELIFQTKVETLLRLELLLSGTLPFARSLPTLQTFLCYSRGISTFFFIQFNSIQFLNISTTRRELSKKPSALSIRFISYYIILNNSIFTGVYSCIRW